MVGSDLKELSERVAQLRSLTEQAQQLASKNPAAARNLYAILQHIEILEIEISDPIRVLQASETEA